MEKWGGPQDYWLVTTGSDGEPGIHGGPLRRMGPTPADMQPVNAHVCAVDVPRLDDYPDRAIRAGGQVVVPKMAISGVGWLAYCKDTEGNVFGTMEADAKARYRGVSPLK